MRVRVSVSVRVRVRGRGRVRVRVRVSQRAGGTGWEARRGEAREARERCGVREMCGEAGTSRLGRVRGRTRVRGRASGACTSRLVRLEVVSRLPCDCAAWGEGGGGGEGEGEG